jgi:hypothetical protein
VRGTFEVDVVDHFAVSSGDFISDSMLGRWGGGLCACLYDTVVFLLMLMLNNWHVMYNLKSFNRFYKYKRQLRDCMIFSPFFFIYCSLVQK